MRITFVDRYCPKLGAPQIIYKNYVNAGLASNVISWESYALIGVESLFSNIQQYLSHCLNYLLMFLTAHDECSVFWECAILNKFLIKTSCLGASYIYDMKCMQISNNCVVRCCFIYRTVGIL